MSHDCLTRALLRWADGHSPDVAAVELLISHNTWLRRSDFGRYLEPGYDADGQELTAIDWSRLAKARQRGLIASASEIAVLDIALSLAEGTPIDLSEVLGLDATNTARVVTALVRAAQHTDTVTVTLADPDRPPTALL